MTKQAILNRIHKLEARQKDNGAIIRKLYRKLRALQNLTQLVAEGEKDE